MSLYLKKSRMRSTLRQIKQDAAAIAKAANEINKEILAFSNDKNLDGEMIESAKERFGDVYYTTLLMIIQACDSLKTGADNLIGKLDAPFPIDGNKMDVKELIKQKEKLEKQVRLYNERKEEGDPGGIFQTLINKDTALIKQYEETIKQMYERNTATRTYFNSSENLIKKLKSVINGIEVGYVKNEKGDPVFTNTKTIGGINLTQIKRDLEFTYADDKIMKAKFDPVNMATGCYVYDKNFLKTEGEISLSFEVRYNSTDPNTQSLGRGWGHNHDIRLEEKEDKIELRLRAERTEDYLKNGDIIVSADGFSGRRLEKSDSEGCSYIYTDEERNKYLFNADGQCIKITDGEGFAIHYGYEDKKLTSVDTDFGTGYRFRYEEERLIEVSDLAERKIKFEYEDEKLTSIIDECGEEYRYEYDDFDKMCKVINARGTVNLLNTYDGLGRVLKQEFPDDGKTRFEYLEDKGTIKVISQDGTSSEYEHDEKYRSTEERYRKGSEKYAYDDANNKISETDKNGNETKYEYDDIGNCIAEITALGDRYEYEYDEDGREVKFSLNGNTLKAFEYNEKGRLISEIDALGRSVMSDYDDRNLLKTITLEDGTIIRYEYDLQGNISKLIDENGNEWKYRYDKLNRVTEAIDGNGNQESFEYNNRNEITRTTNAAGDSRIYEYNESGKLTHCIDFDGNEEFAEYNELNKISKYTDKDGFVTLFEYDKMWNLSKTVDAEGGVNLFTYDGEGRVISVTDANFNTREYSRDANGNVIRESDEDGNYTKYEYDALNRMTTVIYKDGTEEHTEYDALGNEIKFTDAAGNEWQSEYNLEGELLKEINPENLETIYEYDLRGRLIKEQTDDIVISYEYDRAGNLTKITYADGTIDERAYDANGNMTARAIGGVNFAFEYDSLDRMTAVIREDEYIKTFEYDKVGNRVAVTDALGNTTRYIRSKAGDILTAIDPLGNETHYSYDKCHRLIGIDQGEGRVTTYTRDAVGNVLIVTDALGNTEKYEYDCNNQVIAKTDMDGNRTTIKRNIYGDVAKIKYADSTEVEYSYDSLRRLKEVKDSLGVTTIERDILGRETKITDHKGRAVSYSYDRLGNRTSICYANGKVVNYSYGKDKLESIISGDSKTELIYDATGRLSLKKNGLGETAYTYNKLGLPDSLTITEGGNVIDSFKYSYNANGDISRVEQIRQGLPEESGNYDYSYDALGRLAEVNKNGETIRAYTYDAFGNRLSKTEFGRTTKYAYNAANQLISMADGEIETIFAYDKRGNIVQKTAGNAISTFKYSAAGRLASATNSDGLSARYAYNGLGFRVSKTSGNENIDYILDQTIMYNNLLEEVSKDTSREYIWQDDTLIEESGKTVYTDRIGTAIRVGGTSYAYDEFGVPLCDVKGMGFIGYMQDEITGTFFAQAREYTPETGRFAGRDILKGDAAIPRSLNEYTYCHNNPMGFVDFNGMDEARPLFSEGAKERGIQTLESIGVSEVVNQIELLLDRELKKRKIDKDYNKNVSDIEKKKVRLRERDYSKKVKHQKLTELQRKLQKYGKEKIEKIEEINSKYKNDALKKPKKITKSVVKGIAKASIVGGLIDAGIGMIDDYRDGASTTKMLSNAKVNFAFGFAEGAVVAVSFAVNPVAGAFALLGVIIYEMAFDHRDTAKKAENSLE
ncbi:MAG: hypothetical protein IKE52_05215 [Mogibacterium sp.]|nr:hypothetical protein [Mogibacterium sp.]